MENKLAVTGKQSFMGKEIPVVLGGFGPDAKCICDKTIAEIHDQPEREIRRRITDNIKRFRENVDYIDFAQRVGESHTSDLLLNLGYSKQAITQAEHIYILSERGYAKLIKIMDTDLAWEIHDNLIDEYFLMREHIKTGKPLPKRQKTAQELAAADKRATAMLLNAKNRTATTLQKLYEQAGVKPQYQALAISDFYREDGVELPRIALQGTKVTYDKTAIAKQLGMLSRAGKPHALAVGAIIAQLDVLDEEKESMPYHRHGHDGVDWQYTESVRDAAQVSSTSSCTTQPTTATRPGGIVNISPGLTASPRLITL